MQPSAAQRVAVARKLATCCRSRFGVEMGLEKGFEMLAGENGNKAMQ